MNHKSNLFLMTLLLISTLALAACSGGADAKRESMQTALDAWRAEQELVGVTVAISSPDTGMIELASGKANVNAETPLSPEHTLYAGSVTKTFTAAAVLQLVDEGKLSLDDTLAQWFPDYPNAADITIRQLLNMNSGAFDYFHASPENPIIPMLMEDVHHVWTPEEIIQTAASLEPTAAPGEIYNYSNTNYILLGRIIEMETGNSLADEFRTRFYAPLGLENSYMAGYDVASPDLAHGYAREFAFLFGSPEPLPIGQEEMSGLETIMWSAGGLVSTSGDLARWAKALFSEDVVPESLRQEMTTPGLLQGEEGETYGYGVEFYEMAAGDGLGHAGSVPGGFASLTMYLPEHDIAISVMTNDEFGEPLLGDVVDEMLQIALSG